MTAQTHLAHAVLAGEGDRAAGGLCRRRLGRSRRFIRARRQAGFVHHGSVLTRRRNHRRCRHRVRDRDRQRGRGRIAVTILQRVGEHVAHAAFCRQHIALVRVCAIGLQRQLAVLAAHHRACGLHTTRTCLHAHHLRTVCAFGVVAHHVTRDQGIAAARHRVAIHHRAGHIVHDRDRHAATGRLAVLVCHHQIQLRQIQAIRARTCCMRHVVLQLVAVVHHARLDRQVVGVVRLQRARGIIQHGHRCCGIAPQYDTTQLHRTHTVFGRKVSRTCILYASSARS